MQEPNKGSTSAFKRVLFLCKFKPLWRETKDKPVSRQPPADTARDDTDTATHRGLGLKVRRPPTAHLWWHLGTRARGLGKQSRGLGPELTAVPRPRPLRRAAQRCDRAGLQSLGTLLLGPGFGR